MLPALVGRRNPRIVGEGPYSVNLWEKQISRAWLGKHTTELAHYD